jgi:hypothetical protein
MGRHIAELRERSSGAKLGRANFRMNDVLEAW